MPSVTPPGSYSEILALGQTVKDEIAEAANTAERIGTYMTALPKLAMLNYDPQATYAAGQNVVFSDAQWRCLSATAVGENPANTPAKWRRLVGKDTLQDVTERGSESDNVLTNAGYEIHYADIERVSANQADALAAFDLMGNAGNPYRLKALSFEELAIRMGAGPVGATTYQIDGPTSIQEGSNTNVTFSLLESIPGGITRPFTGSNLQWSLLYTPNPNIVINPNTGKVTVPVGTVKTGDYITVRATFGPGNTTLDQPCSLVDVDTAATVVEVLDLYEFLPDETTIGIASLRIDGTPSLNEGGAAGSYYVTAIMTNGTEQPYTSSGTFAWVGQYPNGMVITATTPGACTTKCPPNVIENDVTLTLRFTPTDTKLQAVTRSIPVKDTTGTQPVATITGYRIDGPATLVEGGSGGTYTAKQLYSDQTEAIYASEAASGNPWSLKTPYPNGQTIGKVGVATGQTGVPANSIQFDGSLTIQYTLATGVVITKVVQMVNATAPSLTVSSIVLTAPINQSEGTSTYLTAVATYSNGATQTDPQAFDWALAIGNGAFTTSVNGSLAQLSDCLLGLNGLFTAFNNSTTGDNRDMRVRVSFGGQNDIKIIHILDTTQANNRPPVVSNPAQFTFARQNEAFNYPLPITANQFTDPDGDVLTYTLEYAADGVNYSTTLPGWVNLTGTAGNYTRYAGTPPIQGDGSQSYTLKFRVKASDGRGGIAYDPFNLIVQNVAAPVVTLTGVSITAPSNMDEGTSSVLAAVATYSNGTAVNDPLLFQWALAAATGDFVDSLNGASAQVSGCILGRNGLFTAFNNAVAGDSKNMRVRVTIGGQSATATIHIVDKTVVAP